MDTWIALARGPFFRVALTICVLGLAYRLLTTTWQIRTAYTRAGDKRLDNQAIFKATLQWLLPVRLFRLRPLYGLASAAFHAGIILVPLFYVGHVTLWQRSLPLAWPTLGPLLSDILTIVAAVGLGLILLTRLFDTASRDLTRREDVSILLVLLALMLSGYWAAHPASSPFNPRGMLLVHILLGDLALILTPTTKIVHCVLAPLTQLLSEVGWRFPAASGRHVAMVLSKEKEPI